MKHETGMHIPMPTFKAPRNVVTLSQALNIYANTHAVHVSTSHDQQGGNSSVVHVCDVDLGFPTTQREREIERKRERERESGSGVKNGGCRSPINVDPNSTS